MAGVQDDIVILTPINVKKNKTDNGGKNVAEDAEKYDPLTLCRTCGNVDSCFVHIFKDEGMFYGLNTKIEKYLPIKVSPEDDLPVQVCYHCASTIIAWDNLLIGCVEAEKKLTLLKDSLKEKESKQAEGNNDDDENLVVLNVVNTNGSSTSKRCTRGSKREKKREILQEKSDLQTLETVNVGSERLVEEPGLSFSTYQHHFKDFGPFRPEVLEVDNPECCNVCTEVNRFSFNKGTPKKKVIQKAKETKQREKGEVKNLVCDICKRIFTYKRGIRDHMKIHFRVDIKRYVCHDCGKKFWRAGQLLKHVRVVHEQAEKYSCLECGKTYTLLRKLEDHKNIHNLNWEIMCDKCGKIFHTKSSFYQHTNFHRTKKEEHCEVCDQIFFNKRSLRTHMKKHVAPSLIECELCGKKLKSKVTYRAHWKVHLDLRPFQCSYCGSAYRTKDHLELHLLIHRGEYPPGKSLEKRL